MSEFWIRLDPDNEDDLDKIRFLLKGWKYRSVLWDMDQYLRGRLKYEELSDKEYEALQAARDKLWELINEEGIDIE